MDSSSLDRHLSSGEEAQLAEALELRRKQIDREIAEFTADKEKEFRKFEKRLRSEKRDTERQKILQCEREVEKASIKKRGSKNQRSAQAEAGAGGGKTADVVFRDMKADGVRFAGATEIPQENNAGMKRRKARDGAAGEGPSAHEREVEFQGLFTPIYLPLLGGRRKNTAEEQEETDVVGTSHHDSTRLPVTTAKSVEKPATSNTTAPISGSAPLIRTHSHHLSSSDPRNISMSKRPSSSRSDTSISSRRSSLRDPKQPRSPKRVLFSIDNVVVSPSTSPVTQRKVSSASKNSDGLDIVSKFDLSDSRSGGSSSSKRGGNDDGKFDPNTWRQQQQQQQHPSTQPTKSTVTNIPTPNNTNNSTVNNKLLFHPAAQIGLGLGLTRTSPSMGGDGFEHVGGEEADDLFAFDEDLSRYRDRSLDADGDDGSDENNNDNGLEEEEEEEGGIIPDEGEEELESSSGGGAKEEEELQTSGSSPHAGSLPIEIRWPVRRRGGC
ncbi:MAG: hypothetical protein Q9197_006733 [Variospora fuerteventurae]